LWSIKKFSIIQRSSLVRINSFIALLAPQYAYNDTLYMGKHCDTQKNIILLYLQDSHCNAKCHYTEWHVIMVSVIMLRLIMASVILLSIFKFHFGILCVVMLTVIMLSSVMQCPSPVTMQFFSCAECQLTVSMLCVVLMCAIMLSVVRLILVAPLKPLRI